MRVMANLATRQCKFNTTHSFRGTGRKLPMSHVEAVGMSRHSIAVQANPPLEGQRQLDKNLLTHNREEITLLIIPITHSVASILQICKFLYALQYMFGVSSTLRMV